MTVALLRRAATNLRDPLLSNWSTGVALALADWLTEVADVQEIADLNRDEVFALDHAVATARALLRSWGHDCADDPDGPCQTCKATAADEAANR